MKKITVIWLTVILLSFSMALQGCGDGNGMFGDGGGDFFASKLKADDLSIEDFSWEVVPSKYYGEDCYALTLVNSSDYDIIGVEFTYKVRDDVSDSKLVVYDEFMNEHEGYIEETDSPRDVILRGDKNALVAKGEQLTGLRFTVGFQDWSWYDYPTKEQFELMEPKEMQIGVVGEDDKFYIAYYDFETSSWMLDENTGFVDTWSKKEIAQKISKPAESHHVLVTDDEDNFKVLSYGVTSDEYNRYLEQIKVLGFAGEEMSSSHFEGKSTDGYDVELWYYSEDERLSINIEKEE